MIVVLDACPLIHLAEIRMFDLLKELFGEIYISEAVYAEVVMVGRLKPGSKETRGAESKWLKRKSPKDKLAIDVLLEEFSAGEAETIILSLELNADWVLIDEMKARNRLKILGQKVKGTLGVLMEGYRRGFVTDLKPVLDSLKGTSFLDR